MPGRPPARPSGCRRAPRRPSRSGAQSVPPQPRRSPGARPSGAGPRGSTGRAPAISIRMVVPAPRDPRPADDELEIPAFLRRQAN